jgi:ferritin-like metal-binding protein YciE
MNKIINSRLLLFFVESLQDVYYAEKHLVDALAILEDKATTESLKNAFANHREVTKGHVMRLEEIFRLLGEKPSARRCEAIKGIIREAKDITSETEGDSATRDAGLIFAAQKAEHYEIATYGTLVAFAKTLGLDRVAILLHETLEEEKEADTVLTGIANVFVNDRALQELEW